MEKKEEKQSPTYFQKSGLKAIVAAETGRGISSIADRN